MQVSLWIDERISSRKKKMTDVLRRFYGSETIKGWPTKLPSCDAMVRLPSIRSLWMKRDW